MWLNGIDPADRQEMYEDCCAAYQQGSINRKEFTEQLGKLGYNATDISEAEKFYRPSPPENDDDS